MSKTICFFGATGGVTNAVLTLTLQSPEYKAIALVRTPEKLRDQLRTKQKLDDATIEQRLTIIQGNALELKDVKRALLANVTAGHDPQLPLMIVTGLGGVPRLIAPRFSHPLQIAALDNPTITEDAAKVLVSSLAEIYTEQSHLESDKPDLTFVSTTGLARSEGKPEDVPFGIQTLYHGVLELPHEDKRKMEAIFRGQMKEASPVFGSVTGIRPTLLTGEGVIGEGKGIEKVRAGTDEKPETGYSISRADVGIWTFQNVVKKSNGGKWLGEMVSLA